jgi:glutathionylspermidine synthase
LRPNTTEFREAVDAFLRARGFVPGSNEYAAVAQEIIKRFEVLASESSKVAADFVERAIGPVLAAGNVGLDGLSGEALEEAYLAEFLHDEYRRVASHYRLHFYEGLEAPERGTFLLHLMGCEATFRLVGRRTMICERAMELAKAMQDLLDLDPDQERERDRVYRLIYGL